MGWAALLHRNYLRQKLFDKVRQFQQLSSVRLSTASRELTSSFTRTAQDKACSTTPTSDTHPWLMLAIEITKPLQACHFSHKTSPSCWRSSIRNSSRTTKDTAREGGKLSLHSSGFDAYAHQTHRSQGGGGHGVGRELRLRLGDDFLGGWPLDEHSDGHPSFSLGIFYDQTASHYQISEATHQARRILRYPVLWF